MSEELKPCPICESKREVDITPGQVRCWNCLACGSARARTKDAIKDWNSIPRRLRWTKETPTKPGWYWFRNTNQRDVHVVCIAYEWDEHMVDLELVAWFALEPPYNWHSPHIVARMDGEWAGPIPEPEE